MSCEHHSVFICDRGGQRRLMEVTPVNSVDWQRVQDDVSMANVTFQGSRCDADFSRIEAARHEMVIFRGDQRVWEGPITLLSYEGDLITIQARDVMHYAYRTIMRAPYNNAYPNTTTCVKRAVGILQRELSRNWEQLDPPINVLPYLSPIERPDDSGTARVTIAYEKTVFDDIDDMAARSGMDYCTVGRRIILHDTDTALGRTPILSEQDLVGSIKVTQYGMEMAAFAAVTGAEGQVGRAEGDNGFPDPYYGAWEILDDAYDEEEGTDQPTQAELDSQAKRNVSGRTPTPIEVRVPDGSSIAATSPLYDVDLLVPGVQVPVLARFPSRELTQILKLKTVKWSEGPEGERVEVSLVATNSVIPEEGGEG